MNYNYKSLLVVLLVAVCSPAVAQSPGGVSANITTWFKANTTNPANLTIAGGTVSQWTSEVGGYNVTQSTTSNQPQFLSGYTPTASFNFNPSLQFQVASQRSLNNIISSTDILGGNGTVFIVVNTYQRTLGSSSCFAYTFDSDNRYQMKAHFRIQTGTGGVGYTADFKPQYPTDYGDSAGRILVSSSTGPSFFSKRNGQVFPINNIAPLYDPAVNFGLCIGSNNNGGGGEYSNSAIAEVITYNATLADTDMNKVESYLALKYGNTLDQGSGYQINYVSSNGTIIWNSNANSSYALNITGIGRDDNSGLMQNQSKSVNYNGLVTVFNGTVSGTFPTMNILNSNNFTTDQSFFLFGDNGLPKTLTQCAFDTKVARLQRVWKVQQTGQVDTVTLAVAKGTIPALATNLIVSSDSTFPASSTTIYPLLDSGGYLYTSVAMGSNQFFTFGADTLSVTLNITQPSCSSANGSVTTTVTGGSLPLTFLWVPSMQTTQNISGLSAGIDTLFITQSGGCVDTLPVVINAGGSISNPVIGPIPSICTSGSDTLSVVAPQPGVTYNWYNVPTGGAPVGTGSIFVTPTITSNTTYYLESDSSTCVSNPREIVTVTVNSADTSISIKDTCSSYTWNGSTYTTSGTYYHTFVGGNSSGCDSVATLMLTVNYPDTSVSVIDTCSSYFWNDSTYTSSGTYYKLFAGGNSKGCDSLAILKLTVGKTSTSNTVKTICASAIPYTWNGSNYDSSGTYTYSTTNASGCDSIATLVLTVTPTQVPSISIVTTSIQPSCQGKPIDFEATPTNGGTAPVYQWQVNGVAQGTNSRSFSSAGLNNGDLVTCTLTSNAACASPDTATSAVDMAQVTVFPAVGPITGDTIVCVGTTKTLMESNTNGNWEVNDPALASIDSTGTVTGLSAGNIVVKYVVANPCGANSASFNMYVSGKQPNISRTIIQPTCLYPLSGSITIKITGNEPTYTFTEGGMTYPGDSTTLSNLGEGSYPIYIYNGNECLVDGIPTLALAIKQDQSCDTLYVPSGFLPGNSNTNGVNRLLKPFGGVLLKSLSFRVYNRYGGLVFESHDIYNGWNGSINGTLQDAGTYVWFLDYTTQDGFTRQTKGTSVLIK